MYSKKKFMASIICLTAMANIAPAVAQQELEEVVVTAQKRTQSLQDVPVTVTVLSSDFLDKAQINDFVDIVKVTPGLNVTGSSDGWGQGITLRGVGSLPLDVGTRPGLTFMLNDVPVQAPDAFFNNLGDVEQIEILKGPQSTLYGREASAGVIALTSKRPDLEEFHGHVSAELGSNDLQNYNALVNIPLGETFAVSFSGYYNEVDGEIFNTITGREQSNESVGGRISLLFQPTDSLEFLLRYSVDSIKVRDDVYENQTWGDFALFMDTIPGIDLPPADPFDRKVSALIPSGRNVNSDNASLHINWDINAQWSLTSITGYRLFDRPLTKGEPLPYDVTTIFGNTIPAGTPTGGDAAYAPFIGTAYWAVGSPDNQKTISQEFRLVYSSDKLSSMYGVFYFDGDSESVTDVLFSGAVPLSFNSQAAFTDWSVFTHQTLNVNDKWDLVGGIRYSESERGVIQSSDGFFGTTGLGFGYFGLGPSTLDIDRSATWDSVDASIKVVYFATEDVNYYASIASGFKPGGQNDPGVEDYDEETTVNFEVGIKGLFLDRTLRLNASAFYQTYDDFQVTAAHPDNPVGNATLNAAKVDILGVEIDGVWAVTDRFMMDWAIAYTDASYDSYTDSPCSQTQELGLGGGYAPDPANLALGDSFEGCTVIAVLDYEGDGIPDEYNITQDLTGRRLHQSNRWGVNLNAEYQFPLSDAWVLAFRGGLMYRSDFFGIATLDPVAVQDGYTLFDASVRLESGDGSWVVTLYGKNLTDEDYISGWGVPTGQTGLGGNNVFVGLGTTAGLKVRYNF